MLAPWNKSYDQPRQHIKKQRHYFADKGPSSQSYGFSSNHVWMWELEHKESWVPKNRCFFELQCWKRLLRVPWTARRSNQWILKEVSPEYFGHLMQRSDSLEKSLMLGKIVGRRRRDHRGWGGWIASPTRWTWVWASFGSWWWIGKPGVHWDAKSQTRLSEWTELNWTDSWFMLLYSRN